MPASELVVDLWADVGAPGVRTSGSERPDRRTGWRSSRAHRERRCRAMSRRLRAGVDADASDDRWHPGCGWTPGNAGSTRRGRRLGRAPGRREPSIDARRRRRRRRASRDRRVQPRSRAGSRARPTWLPDRMREIHARWARLLEDAVPVTRTTSMFLRAALEHRVAAGIDPVPLAVRVARLAASPMARRATASHPRLVVAAGLDRASAQVRAPQVDRDAGRRDRRPTTCPRAIGRASPTSTRTASLGSTP